MRLPFQSRPLWSFAALIAALSPVTFGERIIESYSLNSCQANSSFTATLFNVAFTPRNNSLGFNINGLSSISGKVTAEFSIIAYGINALQKVIDPCAPGSGLEGMCPMNTGPIPIKSNFRVDQSVIDQIPSIAYGVPDLDGLVRVYIHDVNDNNKTVACLEAELSNGKTVDQKAVGWTTAVIAGLALCASAVTSGLGHSNTAAHVAANALSLFGFFQAQAMIGMTAVDLPPIVAAWTQNFQWSMGIIHVGFLQDICTWYQRATGGKPSTLLSNLGKASVQVTKRSLEVIKSAGALLARSNDQGQSSSTTKTLTVRGIERVGFRAEIESTNIFLTGIIFFMVFVLFTALGVAMFKGFCELAVRLGWFKGDKFEEFRNGWNIVLKGILFRMVFYAPIDGVRCADC